MCFLLISLQSCKSGQAVVAGTDKKIAEPEAFTEKIPATDISFDMVLIPEGTFEMGSPENQVNRKADEGPMKTVELDAFYMGKYELG
ncbi:MAG: SUMF1/EgtB/PvdO family nonheme iron enzyme, partial [Arenibacter sp.]